MIKPLPKELAQARELMDQAKLDEALKIIERFENEKSLSPENQLSALLTKGRIYLYKQRTRKALQGKKNKKKSLIGINYSLTIKYIIQPIHPDNNTINNHTTAFKSLFLASL